MTTHFDQGFESEMGSSPATTVNTNSTPACFSPFTAPSTASSAPTSPANSSSGGKSSRRRQQQHSGSADNTTLMGDDSGRKTTPKEDAWQHIKDPTERRKVQNRIAQRKYREKAAQKKEAERREARDQLFASGSYARPWVTTPHGTNATLPEEPSTLHQRRSDNDCSEFEFSGVPWGGIAFTNHAIRTSTSRDDQHSMTWQSDQEGIRRQYMDRQRLLWQRQQMQMHRRFRMKQEQKESQEQQQQQQQKQQRSTTAQAHTAVRPPREPPQRRAQTASAPISTTDLTPCHPTRPTHSIPRDGTQSVPNTISPYHNTNHYNDDRLFPLQPAAPSVYMDTFIGGSMFYEPSLQPLIPEPAPMDTSLLASMGGGGGGAMLGTYPMSGHEGQLDGQEVGTLGGIILGPTGTWEGHVDAVDDRMLAWPD